MAEYENLVAMGIAGVIVIALGIWIHWKLNAKKRAVEKAKRSARKHGKTSANRQQTNATGDDFEEDFLTPEDNSLPDDDDDGEFKDTNLFGLKRRKGGPAVYRDWD